MPVNPETALESRREARVTKAASLAMAKMPSTPEPSPSVRDAGKKLQKATGWCLRQFRVHDVAKALYERGVTIEWLLDQLVEMMRDEKCPHTAKLAAWKELRRLQLVVAEVDPRVQRPSKRRARAESAEPTMDPVVEAVEFPKIAEATA